MFGVNVVKRTTIKNPIRIRSNKANSNSQRLNPYRRGIMERQIEEQAALRKWAFEGIEP